MCLLKTAFRKVSPQINVLCLFQLLKRVYGNFLVPAEAGKCAAVLLTWLTIELRVPLTSDQFEAFTECSF